MLRLCSPSSILIVIGSLPIHGCLKIRNNHQRFDLLHDLYQLLSRRPFIPSLEHVSADLPIDHHIRMVDFSLEGNDWSLEGKVVQFELDLELPTLEWGLFRSSHEYTPQGILFLDDLVTPT